MTKKPLISVIVPTYNRVQYIEKSLDSVLSQRGQGFTFEVIVVDDVSTDNTKKLVTEKYGDKVRYIELPKHTGKPAWVRNAGLEIAKGEFIAFQDSDDIWLPDKFSSQMPAFEDKDVVLSYANAKYIKSDGLTTGRKKLVQPWQIIEGYAFIKKISSTPHPMPTPTVIMRKNVIDKIGLFNKKIVVGTDTDYWIRVATAGKFHYLDKTLALIRRDGSNISSMPSEEGDAALYKHEINRIEMYKHIKEDIKLTKSLLLCRK